MELAEDTTQRGVNGMHWIIHTTYMAWLSGTRHCRTLGVLPGGHQAAWEPYSLLLPNLAKEEQTTENQPGKDPSPTFRSTEMQVLLNIYYFHSIIKFRNRT